MRLTASFDSHHPENPIFGSEKTVDWAEKGVKEVTDFVEEGTKNCTK